MMKKIKEKRETRNVRRETKLIIIRFTFYVLLFSTQLNAQNIITDCMIDRHAQLIQLTDPVYIRVYENKTVISLKGTNVVTVEHNPLKLIGKHYGKYYPDGDYVGVTVNTVWIRVYPNQTVVNVPGKGNVGKFYHPGQGLQTWFGYEIDSSYLSIRLINGDLPRRSNGTYLYWKADSLGKLIPKKTLRPRVE